MTSWAPLLFWETVLREREGRLQLKPDNLDLQFERAVVLVELGRVDEAKNAYLEILKRSPTHFGALNNLGALLMSRGFADAAVTAYREAIKHHPNNPKAHANLADTLFQAGDTEGALHHFNEVLRIDPDYKPAHQGLGYILREKGDEEGARFHRRKGFEANHINTLPYRGTGMPVVVVMFASCIGGMIPLRQHLDDRIFHTTVVFVDVYDPAKPLPPHQVIFNAIGDADICQPEFDAAGALLRNTKAPVINRPEAVRVTGREHNARRLGALPDVITPTVMTLPRELLTPEMLKRHGFDFPLLMRRPGFHTGRYFIRVENGDGLAAALAAIPGQDDLLVMQYLDARSPDGKIRKYRVMMIDGELYPLHAAVSQNWKVHYFSAEMANNAEHRAEDEAFLNDMPGILGVRAIAALKQIQTTLGLDYGGMDFSVNAEGQVLLFEANATMTVTLPDPDPRWNYRRPHVARIQEAIRTMLIRRA